MDQNDQTAYDCLLISVAFVVLCRVGCFWVSGVVPLDSVISILDIRKWQML